MRHWVAACVGVLGCVSAAAQGFDAPVRKVERDLGITQESRKYGIKQHLNVTCYYFPTFVVKEFQQAGDKGSAGVRVVPVSGDEAPECSGAFQRGELTIVQGGSYFWGAKGEFIFTQAEEGDGAGYHFRLFDATTGRVKVDDAIRTGTEPVFGISGDGLVTARYKRVFFAKCSLVETGEVCWKDVVRETGLRGVRMPACKGYEEMEPKYRDDPSLISYSVEIILGAKVVRRRVVGGIVGCFAAQ